MYERGINFLYLSQHTEYLKEKKQCYKNTKKNQRGNYIRENNKIKIEIRNDMTRV